VISGAVLALVTGEPESRIPAFLLRCWRAIGSSNQLVLRPSIACVYWLQVLVLYRKHEGARSRHEHGVFACFRYNDLKVAVGDCGGCGLMAGPGLTTMGIESFLVYNLLILHGLGKSERSENRS